MLGAAVLFIPVLAAFCFYPPDADAAYALYDPVWYEKEAIERPSRFVYSHHLLFHLLVLPVASALQSAGFEHPGVWSIRLWSGLGAGVIGLLLLGFGGRTGTRFALLFFLALLSTRGFFHEFALGENVVPACASALAAFYVAYRRPLRPVLLGGLIVLALLFRQDTLFIVPGILLLAADGLPAGRRLRGLATLLLAAGAVTLALYGAAYLAIKHSWGMEQSFRSWMLDLGEKSWNPGLPEFAGEQGPVAWFAAMRPLDLARHGAASGTAVAGRQFHPWEHGHHIAIGGAWIALLILAATLARGRARTSRLWIAIGATILLRVPFFAVFEPTNPEWWLLPMTLLAAGCAATAGGGPAPASVRRSVATWLLALLCGALWISHGSSTWSLRSTLLSEAAEAARRNQHRAEQFFGYQNRSVLALYRAGIPSSNVPSDFPIATEFVKKRILENPRPTIVLIDRSVQDGMPATLRELRNLADAGATPSWPGVAILHQNRSVYVIGLLID